MSPINIVYTILVVVLCKKIKCFSKIFKYFEHIICTSSQVLSSIKNILEGGGVCNKNPHLPLLLPSEQYPGPLDKDINIDNN